VLTSLLEETNASGVAQADYIYLDGRPVAVLNGSTLYFLHDDMLGTPQLATDSAQNIAWLASYDSFGQASVSGTVTQNLRFPGQYFDVESGWNHNGFRDYAPELGRYIEPDPLGRLGSGNNLYAYVGDNPVNLADPLGLCPSNAPNNALAYISKRASCAGQALMQNKLQTGLDALGLIPGEATIVKSAQLAGAVVAGGYSAYQQSMAGAGLSFTGLALSALDAEKVSIGKNLAEAIPFLGTGVSAVAVGYDIFGSAEYKSCMNGAQ